MGYIYMIKNNLNGKVYIGQTRSKYVSQRWGNHRASMRKGVMSPLYNSLRKYGEENFSFDVIMKDVPNDDLSKLEIEMIKKYNSIYPNGFNLTKGGESLFGEDNPMYGRKAWNRGRSLTESEKQNLRDKMTEERKAKSRYFINKYNKSDKAIENRKNYKMTEERKFKNKVQKSSKKVTMYSKDGEPIMSFFSIGLARDYISNTTKFKKADPTTIRKCCTGKAKTAYGYIFKFSE